jgi:hypothetical protein
MSAYYDFRDIRNPRRLKAILEEIMDVANGHDHDGQNSKEVTVGAVAPGSIDSTMFEAGALSADTAGRAAMAANYFDNATTDAKFAANAFAADADSRAKFADGIWTLAKLADKARYHILSYQVEDLGADADIDGRPIFVAPSGLDVTLVSASIIPQGTAAGIDDSNKCIITLTDGTNDIVEKEFNTGTAFPAEGVVTDLGSLDETHKVLASGETLYFSVTNGATANPPAFMLQVVYAIADAS